MNDSAMETPDGKSVPNQPAEVPPSAPPSAAHEKMSSLETLGAVIISPFKAFRLLVLRPQWLMPSLILLLWLLVSLLKTLLPGLMTLSSMGTDQGRQSFAFAPPFLIAMGLVQLAVSVCLLAAVFFLMTGALYFILKSFNQKAPFFTLASGLAFAEFVPRLARISLQEAIPLFTGGGTFARELPTGILRLLSDVDFPKFLEPLLGRVELFHIWSFALMVILLKFTAGVSRNKGIAITAAYWLVCILVVTGFTVGGELLKEAMMGSVG